MQGRGGANGKRKANLLYSSRNDGRSKVPPPQCSNAQENDSSLPPIRVPTQSSGILDENTILPHGAEDIISTPNSAGECIQNKKTRGRYKGMKLDVKTMGGVQIEVHIPDEITRAVGPNARDLVNHCGLVVRTTAPLATKNWKEVTDRVGEQMLMKIKEKFKVGRNLEYRLEAFALDTMQRLYRVWRGRLSKEYKHYQTDEERIANPPKDIDIEDWKHLVDYFGSEEFKRVSERNTQNRQKLVVKHTCGTRSFAEVEESTRDPDTGEKAQVHEVWYMQHTEKSKEGEIVWSDPKSQEVYEKLQKLISQPTPEGSTPMIGDEMLLSVLGERTGYFRGKGYGKKAPSKRGKIQEVEINARINQAVEERVEQAVEERVQQRIEEMKNEVNTSIESIIESRLESRMASILSSFAQSNSHNIPESLIQCVAFVMHDVSLIGSNQFDEVD